ncbi:hypothetical protein ACUN0C_19095 [Faunimonas sp. B44]|uniref:hypothetical protein n=1 Tax=Faunimonas sp. B44 TaxID=3461493 RepID=UPI004044FC3B
MNRFLATTLPFAFAWSKLPDVNWDLYTPFPNTPVPFENEAAADVTIRKICSALIDVDDFHAADYLSSNWRRALSFPKTAHDYAERLTRLGFYEIGSGCYSRVYKRIGSDRVVKVCAVGDLGIDYLIWAHENGWAGNWAPKIYSARRFADGAYIAVLEHLEATVSRVPKYKTQYEDMRRSREHPFMKALRDRFPHTDFDLHNNNWMIRKTGQLVLVDPLSESGTSTNKFEKLRFAA